MITREGDDGIGRVEISGTSFQNIMVLLLTPDDTAAQVLPSIRKEGPRGVDLFLDAFTATATFPK